MKKILIVISFVLLISCQKDISVSKAVLKTVFIDPGHGGKDNGCVFNSIYEDEINLNISKYLYESLINHNYLAYISRTSDYDLASLYSKNRKNEDLKKRVYYINNSSCDFFVSIHLNYYSDKKVYGPMVYYQKNNEKSKMAAKIVQNALNEFTDTNKIIHEGDYYILNKAKKDGILIECGFLSNLNERDKLNNEKYQMELANIIYNSLDYYFSVL